MVELSGTTALDLSMMVVSNVGGFFLIKKRVRSVIWDLGQLLCSSRVDRIGKLAAQRKEGGRYLGWSGLPVAQK